jgi:hypothetical protein
MYVTVEAPPYTAATRMWVIGSLAKRVGASMLAVIGDTKVAVALITLTPFGKVTVADAVEAAAVPDRRAFTLVAAPPCGATFT